MMEDEKKKENKEEKEDEIYDLEKDKTETAEDASSEEAGNNNEVTADKEEEKQEDRNRESEAVKPNKGEAALESIREMVSDLGAERVLELIRDNRNAAIEQILAELKASEEGELPLRSGLSVEPKCQSIFDLASFA